MSTNEYFTISEKKKEIDQLRSSMSPDVDREMYNDTYQIYLILKEHNFDVSEAEIALRRYEILNNYVRHQYIGKNRRQTSKKIKEDFIQKKGTY
ncbi:hypothetical protein TNCV_4812881 [Trichonephila clavipes]|nr:hypothetical protein TNCV_4812881 [Trichonephila clavipes]